MVKNYFFYCIIILLATSSTAFGQKYEFDYVMEYEYKKDKKAKPLTYLRFTNSRDNSFNLTLYERDSLNFNMEFIDAKNGFTSENSISKKHFSEVEALGIKFPLLQKYNSKNKDQIKQLEFIPLKDTLINKQMCRHLVLAPVTKKINGREQDGNHFLILPKTDFHLPNFHPGSVPYYKSITDNTIPPGIFKEFYTIKNGNKTDMTVLLQYTKLKKITVFDETSDQGMNLYFYWYVNLLDRKPVSGSNN